MVAGLDRRIDAHVGSRVRARRKLLGLSQTKLGQAVGLTFQQIQKYERGANRIGAGRLYQFSEVLDVPISFFFDQLPAEITSRQTTPVAPAIEAVETDQLLKKESLELVQAYYQIRDRVVRNRIRHLVKLLAGPER